MAHNVAEEETTLQMMNILSNMYEIAMTNEVHDALLLSVDSLIDSWVLDLESHFISLHIVI